MGQQEVYEFLQNHPGEWFTSNEISRAIGIGKGAVTMSLKKLRESDEVMYGRTNSPGKSYRYKFKE
ncbi:MAG: hypothetical protein QGH39_05045 [Candidatus Thermoplasmatota archaeon]|jgi:predicted transcriptional regulator|nr:hypothetical protein [Candidatus Thermoplasmatota archaeon]MDP7264911.1 hypothetical protein [Candidatus Thermoplasmatota archaeon]